MLALLLTLSAHALIMGEKSYRIEVSKSADNSIILDVIHLRDFTSVESTAVWCYQTHKKTEGKTVWYSNVVDLDFTGQFTDQEIETICWKFVSQKVYPNRIKKVTDQGVLTDRYSPGFLGHHPMANPPS